jgi:hypothetical protein
METSQTLFAITWVVCDTSDSDQTEPLSLENDHFSVSTKQKPTSSTKSESFALVVPIHSASMSRL